MAVYRREFSLKKAQSFSGTALMFSLIQIFINKKPGMTQTWVGFSVFFAVTWIICAVVAKRKAESTRVVDNLRDL